MTTDSKVLVGLLGATLCWSFYSHNALSEEIMRTQQYATTCSCPQDNYDQVNHVRINELTRHSVSSHSYAEHLLEGLVRHSGLPLEAARKAFSEGMKDYGGVPSGWRWLTRWEGGPAAKPATE